MRHPNRRRWPTSCLLAAGLALSLACVAREAPPPEIENLRAFTKLYGYVRFFHPSDEAGRTDWDKLAVYGAARVKSARDRDELRQRLEELFLPIAPTLRLFPTGQEPAELAPRWGDDTSDLKVVAWQHRGLGLGDDETALYRSARTNRAISDFGALTNGVIAAEYQGHQVRLRAAVRTAVSGAGNQGRLWLRVDRARRQQGFFDDMADRPITSNEWRVYEIVGELAEDAVLIYFGGRLQGEGTVWLDAFELAIRDPADAGSDDAWQPVELDNPDFETPGEEGTEEKITGWLAASPGYAYRVESQGAFQGKQCALIEKDESTPVQLFDHVPAIGEAVRKQLGRGLSCYLPVALFSDAHGTLGGKDPEAAEKLFAELAAVDLEELSGNDEPLRVATVVIAWNVFQHFYPYFDVVPTDWDAQLTRSLGEALRADGDDDLLLALRRLTASLHDGHANAFNPALGGDRALIPIGVDWVEGQVVVVASENPEIVPGDVVVSVDGVPAEEVLVNEEQFLSGTAQWKRFRSLLLFGWGEQGTEARLRIRRQDQEREVVLRRDSSGVREEKDQSPIDDLGAGVFYVDLSRAAMAEINGRLEELARARGIVFDLRGYPQGNHEVIRHFIDEPVQSAQWNVPLVIYPDQEKIVGWDTSGRWLLEPKKPRFEGKIVFLTNGRAISYAESFMGIIEHYRLAEIVGQPTAGANGNVNPLNLPGGYRMTWTGMKVLKHDGSQHHLVGIRPTVPVARTIAGVAAGRDEYLEKALALINR